MQIKCVGLDADDTLWHNEVHFLETRSKFKKLLSQYHEPEWVEDHLDETEARNIKHFGYGIKGFTLSMVETAIELSDGKVTGSEIATILEFGKDMINSPLEIFDDAKEVVKSLSEGYKLLLITKGDLFDQELKIARSGLADYFSDVEIVSEKTRQVYKGILEKNKISPAEFVMVGNSMRSDILPVVEIGGIAVHIPSSSEWKLDAISEKELEGKTFETIESLSILPEWLYNKKMY